MIWYLQMQNMCSFKRHMQTHSYSAFSFLAIRTTRI